MYGTFCFVSRFGSIDAMSHFMASEVPTNDKPIIKSCEQTSDCINMGRARNPPRLLLQASACYATSDGKQLK